MTDRLGPFSLDTIVCGDCPDVMCQIPDGCVDLVVTDPPYNVGITYVNSSDERSDYPEWCSAWFSELRRVCSGPMAISVGQANLSRWAQIAPPDWWLAWWKPAAMGRCVVGFNNWEPIAFYGKPSRAMCDVIRATIKPDPNLVGHPCPKPLEWATQQIEKLSRPGEALFDPFLGSGTTAIAAKKLDRHYFGCDISQGYIDMANRRLARVDGVQLALLGVT